jgi:two-component system sensor histidine kinase HydH
MDLRTQTSLVAALLSLALAVQVLLRSRKRRVHWTFGFFGLTVAAWYLAAFLDRFVGGPVLQQVELLGAVLVPVGAVQFFRTFLEPETRQSTNLLRVSVGLAVAMAVLTLTPLRQTGVFAAAIFLYVAGLLGAVLWMLYRAGQAARSRFEQARLFYLTVVGGLAALFTFAEYLPYLGVEIPPVGTILILVFLYVLSQSLLRYRLLDLYELAGRLTLLTALSFSLAGMVWLLVALDPGHFFLHSVVAALVLFLLADPFRTKLEQQINQIFLRERYDLEQAVKGLKSRLAHTLELPELTDLLLRSLEASGRITDASFFLIDATGQGYDLRGHLGEAPEARFEVAQIARLLDGLREPGAVVLETVERDLQEAEELGETREAKAFAEVLALLEALRATVCVGLVQEDGDVLGFLALRDDRLRDAFNPEEVELLAGLAMQATVAVENSRLYQQLKQRDRLAALGEMAAGLAHEIRNPLGAIKASAQLLADTPRSGDPEFLDIIVDEVDRLNRVVSSFLDYARPSEGSPEPTDVNAVVRRTHQLLQHDLEEGLETRLGLAEDLPRVRIDAERLRQVLLNLIGNAVQAMEGDGQLTLRTKTRVRTPEGAMGKRWVEVSVTDTGPGIAPGVLQNLFVPFVTTKDQGTGLGLAISQRIVTAAGGQIEVRTHVGVGSTFVVRLPAVEEREVSKEVRTESTSSRPPAAGVAAEAPA